MNYVITLTTAGADTGPFNIYSDVDGFLHAFDTNVPKTTLLAGFPTINVPMDTTTVRVESVNELCNNYVDTIIMDPLTTTTTTTTEYVGPITTTTTTTAAPLSPKIGNATITTNNYCQTVFEGSYLIPAGTTATIIGTQVLGYEGGGSEGLNGVVTVHGTITGVTAGIYPYTVDLGNSNEAGVASSYTFKIILDNGKEAIKLFQRTSLNHIAYDTPYC